MTRKMSPCGESSRQSLPPLAASARCFCSLVRLHGSMAEASSSLPRNWGRRASPSDRINWLAVSTSRSRSTGLARYASKPLAHTVQCRPFGAAHFRLASVSSEPVLAAAAAAAAAARGMRNGVRPCERKYFVHKVLFSRQGGRAKRRVLCARSTLHRVRRALG